MFEVNGARAQQKMRDAIKRRFFWSIKEPIVPIALTMQLEIIQVSTIELSSGNDPNPNTYLDSSNTLKHIAINDRAIAWFRKLSTLYGIAILFT